MFFFIHSHSFTHFCIHFGVESDCSRGNIMSQVMIKGLQPSAGSVLECRNTVLRMSLLGKINEDWEENSRISNTGLLKIISCATPFVCVNLVTHLVVFHQQKRELLVSKSCDMLIRKVESCTDWKTPPLKDEKNSSSWEPQTLVHNSVLSRHCQRQNVGRYRPG